MFLRCKSTLAVFLTASASVNVKAFAPSIYPTFCRSNLAGTSRLFSSMDIADPKDVLDLLQKPNAIILDVRSDEEIINDGFLQTSDQIPWLQVACTPEDCPLLNVAAQNMIPDKTTPIVIHCASGRRASKAKEILEGQGYTNVLNAGGFKDLAYLQEAAKGN